MKRRKRFIKVEDGSVVKPSKSTAIELWRPRRTPWWDLRRFLPQPAYKTVEALYAELEATRAAQRQAALRAQEILATPPTPPDPASQLAVPLPPASAPVTPLPPSEPLAALPPVDALEVHVESREQDAPVDSNTSTQDVTPYPQDDPIDDPEDTDDDATPLPNVPPEGAVPTEELSYEAIANLHLVYDLPEPLPPRRLVSKR